ncbi:MAG: NAD(P)H-hydrate dehydratase [Bacillota bacterium]|jgi:hydroxyethylthiazole kinase-like uncharacterized protein yjeF
MIYLADGEQMRNIDRQAMAEYAVPGLLLMEAASSFAARIALEVFRPQGPVVVVAGGGNNGGDGWGAARHLAAAGRSVKVVTSVDPAELQGDAAAQFALYQGYGLPWEMYRGREQFAHCALILDALLGTGVKGAPRGQAAEIIAAINSAPAPVLAVDIPSGLPAGCLPAAGEVVQAEATATFGLAKAGLYTPAGRRAAGTVFVDAIGLPPQLLADTGLVLNDAANAARGLPRRPPDSHKGSFGHGLLVAGSRGMAGAAILAGNSALRSGIGLLTIACPHPLNATIQGSLWEALSLPLPSTEAGTFAPEAAQDLDLEKYSAAAIGPGCRVCPGTAALAERLIRSPLPLVLDADALNTLAPGIPVRDYPTVISPHPGEMARLLACNTEDILANPLDTCRRAARQWGCTVILKGASSYISDPRGNAAVNITGTHGLATGGSGDILTGLLLGLLAQGAEPFAAACTATWLLGTASELAETASLASQLPRDVLAQIGLALARLEAVST